MFSTSVVVSLVLAVVFGAAALLLWRSRNHAPSSSDVPDPEPSGQKPGGSRIGACICLAVLALLSQFVCSLIYLVILSIPALLSFLPDLLLDILTFALYPVFYVVTLIPVLSFLPWASDCTERICPSRHGLRYSVLIGFNLFSVAVNGLACLLGLSSFRLAYFFPLVYAFSFSLIRSSL